MIFHHQDAKTLRFLDADYADSAGFVSRRVILDKVCALNVVCAQDLYLVCRPLGAPPKAVYRLTVK